MLRNKRAWLDENHIKVMVNVDEKESELQIRVYQKDFKTGEWKELKQTINVKHHPYGKDCIYVLVFPWDYNLRKRVTMTLQRIVYMYYKGDIKEGFDIDHVDNDSLNNLPTNLQAISRKDNLKKRQKSQREISVNYREIERNLKNQEQKLV